MPWPLFTPGKDPSSHCTGGWVGPRASVDKCGKSRPHRDSNILTYLIYYNTDAGLPTFKKLVETICITTLTYTYFYIFVFTDHQY